MNYVVLMLSAGLDFYSWRISYLEIHKEKKTGEIIWDQIIRSKDPAVFTVFLEDLVSLIGTFFAFAGIFLGQIFHNPYFDPVASLLIGLLLIAVAALLGRESGALLVGERAHKASIQHIEAIIKREPAVERLGELLTMQLGPEEALLTANIRFRRDLNTEQMELAIKRIEHDIQSKEPDIKQIFIEANSLG